MAQRRLRVEIRGDARPLITALRHAEQRVEAFSRTVVRAQHTMLRTQAAQQAATGRMIAGMTAAQAQAGRTGQAMAAGMATGAAAHNRTAATAAAAGQRTQRSLQGTQRAHGALAASAALGSRRMVAGFDDARKHAGAMHGRFENYAGFVGFQMLGRQAIVMGTMIAGAMAMSAKAFMDFEDTFALVRKTTQATELDYANLSAEIREMARTVPLAVTELNEVAGVAGQLGVPIDTMGEFTRIMAEMGVATNLTSEQAAISFARIAAVMQESLDDEGVGRMTSAVVDLGNNFAAREDEIVRFMERIAAAGQVVGLTTADIAAFSTAFTAVGVRAERGGTAFQRVVFEMMQAVQNMGHELNVIAETAGMAPEAFADLWREDAGMAVIEFIEGLDRAGEDANRVMVELFGNNVRTTQSFLALAGAGDLGREALERGRRAFDQNIARAAEAEERFSTLANRIRVFANRMRDVAIEVGSRVAPVLAGMIETITRGVEAFGAIPKPLQDFILTLSALGAVAGIVGGSMLLMVFPMRVLQGLLPGAIAGWRSLTGIQYANAAAMASANPLLKVSAASAAASGKAAAGAATGWAAFGVSMRATNVAAAAAVTLTRVTSVVSALGARLVALAKAVAPALLGFGKFLLIAGAMFAAFRGGQAIIRTMRGEFVDVADAAEQVALSMDIGLSAFETFRDQIDDTSGTVRSFRQEHEELIEALERMGRGQAEATIWHVALEMERRGADPEDIETAVRNLAQMSGTSMRFSFDFGDADAVAENLRSSVRGLLEDFGAFDTLPFVGSGRWREFNEIMRTLGETGDLQGLARSLSDINSTLDVGAHRTNAINDALESFTSGLARNNNEAAIYQDRLDGVRRMSHQGATELEMLAEQMTRIAQAAAGVGDVQLFQHIINEADRLGLQLGLTDDYIGGLAMALSRHLPDSTVPSIDAMALLSEEVELTTEEVAALTETLDSLAKLLLAHVDPVFAFMEAQNDLADAVHARTLREHELADAADKVADLEEKLSEARSDGESSAREIAAIERELEQARLEQESLLRDTTAAQREQTEAYLAAQAAALNLAEGIAAGSVSLETLAAISENVADHFGWTAEEAANFEGALDGVFGAAGPAVAAMLEVAEAGGYTEDVFLALGVLLPQVMSETEAAMVIAGMQAEQTFEQAMGNIKALAEDTGREVPEALAHEYTGSLTSLTQHIMDTTGKPFEQAAALAEQIAQEGGMSAGEATARGLASKTPRVAAEARAYARAIAQGINPVLAAMGAARVSIAAPNIGGGTSPTTELQAAGSVRVDGALPSNAVIQRPKSNLVQWAEPETGGEAFIPLARSKRRRSLGIWAETGKRLGIPLPAENFATMQEGGMFTSRASVPGIPDYSHNGIARSAHSASRKLREDTLKKVDEFVNLMGSFGGGGRGGGLATTVGRLNPQFLARFRAWSAARGPFSITSGWRSSAQQAVLYARYLAGRGPLAAPPGRSMHERGLAIDHRPHSWGIAATARPFGLHHPVRSESWHTEPRAEGGIFHGVQTFDKGGLLKPGVTVAVNKTGSPESVFADGGIMNLTMHDLIQGLGAAAGTVAGITFDPRATARAQMPGGESNQWRPFFLGPMRQALMQGRSSDEMREIRRRQELQHELMQDAAEEARLQREIAQARRDGDKDALRQAQAAFRDWQTQRAIQIAQREQDRLIAIREEQERREENKRALEFEKMNTREQIADLGRRMEAHEKYTDEWTALYRERARLMEQETQEQKQALEDERQTLMQHVNALGGITQRMERVWGSSTGMIIRNIEQQTQAFKDHTQGLSALRARGLDDDIIEALGLLDPRNLHQVNTLLRSTDTELLALIQAFGSLQNVAGLNLDTINARQYDSGGRLPPGLTMAWNRTGAAEYVLRPTSRGTGAEAPHVIEVTVPTTVEMDGKVVAKTVTTHQKREDRSIRVRSGKGTI